MRLTVLVRRLRAPNVRLDQRLQALEAKLVAIDDAAPAVSSVQQLRKRLGAVRERLPRPRQRSGQGGG
jgi:hypothetical protein